MLRIAIFDDFSLIFYSENVSRIAYIVDFGTKPHTVMGECTTNAIMKNLKYDVSSWSRNFILTLWFTFWLILRHFSDHTISRCKQNCLHSQHKIRCYIGDTRVYRCQDHQNSHA